jgi:hypothetical protein
VPGSVAGCGGRDGRGSWLKTLDIKSYKLFLVRCLERERVYEREGKTRRRRTRRRSVY